MLPRLYMPNANRVVTSSSIIFSGAHFSFAFTEEAVTFQPECDMWLSAETAAANEK